MYILPDRTFPAGIDLLNETSTAFEVILVLHHAEQCSYLAYTPRLNLIGSDQNDFIFGLHDGQSCIKSLFPSPTLQLDKHHWDGVIDQSNVSIYLMRMLSLAEKGRLSWSYWWNMIHHSVLHATRTNYMVHSKIQIYQICTWLSVECTLVVLKEALLGCSNLLPFQQFFVSEFDRLIFVALSTLNILCYHRKQNVQGFWSVSMVEILCTTEWGDVHQFLVWCLDCVSSNFVGTAHVHFSVWLKRNGLLSSC